MFTFIDTLERKHRGEMNATPGSIMGMTFVEDNGHMDGDQFNSNTHTNFNSEAKHPAPYGDILAHEQSHPPT